MTWWEGILIGIGLLTAGLLWQVYRPLSAEDRADAEEQANMCRYLLNKHPEIKRELSG